MPQDEIFRKVFNEDTSRILRLKVIWEEHNIRITIIDECLQNAWCADVKYDELKPFADQHDRDIKSYTQKLRNYLNGNETDITYKVVQNQFIVYRNIDKIKIKCFSTLLEKVDYAECLGDILDDLCLRVDTLKEQNELLEKQKDKAEKNQVLFQQKLEEFVKLKDDSEKELYSNFLLILNEKKKRIQYLNEVLETYRDGSKSVSASVKNKKNSSVNILFDSDDEMTSNISSKPLETISDSDSYQTDSYVTDDEEKQDKMEVTETVEPQPSTSKAVLLDLRSDSPPPITIPKRAKREVVKKDIISPKKDKQVPVEEKTIDVQNKSNKTKDVEDDSPSMEFNTQDLLNRL